MIPTQHYLHGLIKDYRGLLLALHCGACFQASHTGSFPCLVHVGGTLAHNTAVPTWPAAH